MRTKIYLHQLFSVTLTFCVLCTTFMSCGKDSIEGENPIEVEPPKDNGNKPPIAKPIAIDPVALILDKTTLVKTVLSNTTKELAEGITYTNLKYISSADKNMSMHILMGDFGYSKVTTHVLNI